MQLNQVISFVFPERKRDSFGTFGEGDLQSGGIVYGTYERNETKLF